MNQLIDLTGKRFGSIEVLERVSNKNNGKSRWKCKCDCGKVYECNGSNLTHNQQKECWTCSRTLEYGLAAKRAVFRSYRRNAITRSHLFEFDFESFIILCALPCVYCGDQPSLSAKKLINYGRCNNGDFTYNGIDRVDNSNGYTKENCVPCCVTCNMMKKAMGKDKFLGHIKKIAKHQAMLSMNEEALR